MYSYFKINFRNYLYAGIQPFISTSVSRAWKALKPPPVGILDQLVSTDYIHINICAGCSAFLSYKT